MMSRVYLCACSQSHMHEMSNPADSPIFDLDLELWTCMRALEESGIDVDSNAHDDWGLQSQGWWWLAREEDESKMAYYVIYTRWSCDQSCLRRSLQFPMERDHALEVSDSPSSWKVWSEMLDTLQMSGGEGCLSLARSLLFISLG